MPKCTYCGYVESHDPLCTRPKPRTVVVDGNCFWMEVDGPSGGYIVGAPVGDPEALFELDPRAFRTQSDYEQFREAIRFLTTYQRG